MQSDSGLLSRVAVVLEPKSAAPRTSAAKKSAHASSVAINTLKSHQGPVFLALLTITFLAQFYAADLKGIWNDEAVRLTIANGGLATAPFETRQPGQFADVLKAIENFATQPAYLLLVNGILRITHSYSVIPIVTANLLMFLFSAVGIYLLARSLSPWGVLVSVLLYLWNGFAMVHVLQTREYSLILCLLVWNMAFFYWLFKVGRVRGRRIFWWISLAHFLTTLAAVYATNWAPFFLWPQAVIALLLLRRKRSAALTVCGESRPCRAGLAAMVPEDAQDFGVVYHLGQTASIVVVAFNTVPCRNRAPLGRVETGMFVLAYSLLLDASYCAGWRRNLFRFWFSAPTVRDSASGLNDTGLSGLSDCLFFPARAAFNRSTLFHSLSAVHRPAHSTRFVAPGELGGAIGRSTSVAPDRRAFVVRCSRISSSSEQL